LAHALLGLALANKDDWDGAVAEYREALRLDPNDGLMHLGLGLALWGKGNWDGAITEYREALRLNPNNETEVCLLRKLPFTVSRIPDSL